MIEKILLLHNMVHITTKKNDYQNEKKSAKHRIAQAEHLLPSKEHTRPTNKPPDDPISSICRYSRGDTTYTRSKSPFG